MAFDETLADRVRSQLEGTRGLVEKKMFGGVAFMLNGNMSVGIHGTELIVRVAPESTPTELKRTGVRIFDITGRPMQGWLLVDKVQLTTAKALSGWVQKGVAFAQSLPKK